MEEKIKAKIAVIEGERAAYLESANKQLAAFEGALQVLRQLLADEAPQAAIEGAVVPEPVGIEG